MDERSAVRVVSDREVAFHSGDTIDRAVLYNVSTGGCMLGVPGEVHEQSEFLCVKLGGLPVDGHIVWRRGNMVGVRFVQSVHPVLVDHLAFREPDEDIAAD